MQPGLNGELQARLNLSPQAPERPRRAWGACRLASTNRERYTLTHLHAKGGMGRVWLARDGALGRQIALKELRPDQADNSIVCSRFLYEAKITAQLEHPGIVPVYELGEGDAPYYTMRFVRGRTLSEAIRAYHKKRAAGEADSVGRVELLSAFVSVCHAVAYAHSRGIIHRDLKGQNVVLGDFGEVMVLDWGLAKRLGLITQADGSEHEAALAEPAPRPLVSRLSTLLLIPPWLAARITNQDDWRDASRCRRIFVRARRLAQLRYRTAVPKMRRIQARTAAPSRRLELEPWAASPTASRVLVRMVPCKASSWGRRPTWRPSKRRGVTIWSTSGPTCTAWGRSFTRS